MCSLMISGIRRYKPGQLVTLLGNVYRITKGNINSVCKECDSSSNYVCATLHCCKRMRHDCNLKLVKHKG